MSIHDHASPAPLPLLYIDRLPGIFPGDLIRKARGGEQGHAVAVISGIAVILWDWVQDR